MTPYMIPLIVMPVIITGNGIYQTRCGELVVINEIDRKPFGCHGIYPNGTNEHWHTSGRLYANTQSDNDIVRNGYLP